MWFKDGRLERKRGEIIRSISKKEEGRDGV